MSTERRKFTGDYKMEAIRILTHCISSFRYCFCEPKEEPLKNLGS